MDGIMDGLGAWIALELTSRVASTYKAKRYLGSYVKWRLVGAITRGQSRLAVG